MPCADIDQAIAWAKQNVPLKHFVVTAYFTKHTGSPGVVGKNDTEDYCWYAVGAVTLNPAGHLSGDLQLYANGGVSSPPEPIVIKPDSTIGVEIFPNGTFTYQQKIKNKPVGGMPPTKVALACLGGAMLTGTSGTDVIAVGVRRSEWDEPP